MSTVVAGGQPVTVLLLWLPCQQGLSRSVCLQQRGDNRPAHTHTHAHMHTGRHRGPANIL